jgi:hypothetical protein
MNGNFSTSPEEESATGRPFRDPLTGHLLSPRSTTDRQARGHPLRAEARTRRRLPSSTSGSRCSLVSLPLRTSGERLTAAALARARGIKRSSGGDDQRLAWCRTRHGSPVRGTRRVHPPHRARRQRSHRAQHNRFVCRCFVPTVPTHVHHNPPPANADRREVPGSSPGSPTSPGRGRPCMPSTTVLVHGCHASR